MAKVKKTKLGYSFLVLEKQDPDKRNVADGRNRVESNASDIYKAAVLAKEIGCDYFEVKPSFDPFHFLNDTSNLTNIIKSQLEMCLPPDEHFKVISPYTLSKVLDGEKIQQKEYSECMTAHMEKTVLSQVEAYVCPYHRGKIYKLEIPIKKL